jgi:hypothetical protein
LENKDTGDAAGDIFFYIGDRLPQTYACRRDPHAFGCNERSILVHDSVYTQ